MIYLSSFVTNSTLIYLSLSSSSPLPPPQRQCPKSLAITVVVLAAITAALTEGTVAITTQSAAAYSRDSNDPNSNNSIDKENSGTNFKFKEKDKNNCSGFTVCCNVASQSVGALIAIPVCPID
jgi:hypothetical protein